MVKYQITKMKQRILMASVAISQSLLPIKSVFAQTDIATPPAVEPYSGTSVQDVVNLLAKLAGWLLYVAGAIAVVFLIIGGVFYITSAGDADKSGKAKKIIVDALIGLVIIALSLLIVNLVTEFFG